LAFHILVSFLRYSETLVKIAIFHAFDAPVITRFDTIYKRGREQDGKTARQLQNSIDRA